MSPSVVEEAASGPALAHRRGALPDHVRHGHSARVLRRLPAHPRRALRVEPGGHLGGAVDESAGRRRRGLRGGSAGRPLRPPPDPGGDGDPGRDRLRPRLGGRRALAALSPRGPRGRGRHVELLPAERDDDRAVVRCPARAGAGPGPGRVQPRLYLRRAAGGLAHRCLRLARGLCAHRERLRRALDAGRADRAVAAGGRGRAGSAGRLGAGAAPSPASRRRAPPWPRRSPIRASGI